MKFSGIIRLIPVIMLAAVFMSCQKDAPTPTKERMDGVWLVTEAYDSAGTSIIDKFQNPLIPITAFYLGSDNTVLSTAGPMVTYMVYGEAKWTQFSSIIDQCFNYADLTFNGGEFFVADGVVDRFTLEMKLEGIGGTSTLADILSIFNIEAQWLKEVVYHKFLDVKVTFSEDNQRMIWELDNTTWAKYNMKNAQGEYVLWGGWPVTKFTRCKFVLDKKVKTLNDIVDEAYNPTPTKVALN